MRALIQVLLACAALTVPAAEAKVKLPKEHVLIESPGEFGSSWTKVYKKGSLWICQTDAFPYYESSSDPLAGLDWKAFESSSKAGDCRKPVDIVDQRGAKPQRIRACEDSPKVREWMDHLYSSCGRR